MQLIDFIKNKYTISLLILIACGATDIILHKGMSRVMIPSSFTDKIVPLYINPLNKKLSKHEKEWAQGINKPEAIKMLDSTVAGFEMDVFIDTTKRALYAYHDSDFNSHPLVMDLLSIYSQKKMKVPVWLDLKNLNQHNKQIALSLINVVRDSFSLKNKMIIESSSASSLNIFSNEDYFTSYYIPYFNPYLIKEPQLVNYIRCIADSLQKYPTAAVSGYYFQYPVLKKFFPNYPILTWSDQYKASVVAYTFNRQLRNDSMVKVILYHK